MKHAAQNPTKNVIAIIPARMASTRLEGKMLLSLAGKPLILHTIERAKAAKNISRVIVATDDAKILRVVKESRNEAVLTSPDHQSGSDRIAEVAKSLNENSIIVNVQGDEPLIPPGTIEKAVDAILADDSIQMATTCEPIREIQDVLSPDVVKVVLDENNFALYFSRSPIPFSREAVKKYGSLENALNADKNLLSLYRKHTGLYVYRREFLLEFTKLKQTNLEKTEMLEQLRALENGAKIKVVEVSEGSIGVDTQEDFERVRWILENKNIIYRRATAIDVPDVAKVHVESWQKSFAGIVPGEHLDNMSAKIREERFREAFEKPDYKMFVAEDTERGIIGFADFGPLSVGNFQYQTALYAIYLLRDFQRRGIGKNLFRLCQKEMISDGFNSMFLEALECSPYRSFYEMMGGRVVGHSYHFLSGVEYKTLIYGWDNLREHLKNE